MVASGRTNFAGDGGDLANIYVPANSYDTWKQYIVKGDAEPVEGEFIYQMRNATRSCLTIELRWGFARESSAKGEPMYECVATPLAMALVASQAAAQTINSIEVVGNRRVEIETIRSYFRPGPGGQLSSAAIIIVHKHGNDDSRVRVLNSSSK